MVKKTVHFKLIPLAKGIQQVCSKETSKPHSVRAARSLPMRAARKNPPKYKETLRPKKEAPVKEAKEVKKEVTVKKDESVAKKRPVENAKGDSLKKKVKMSPAQIIKLEKEIARKEETIKRRELKIKEKEAKKQAKLKSLSPLLIAFNLRTVLKTANGKHISD